MWYTYIQTYTLNLKKIPTCPLGSKVILPLLHVFISAVNCCLETQAWWPVGFLHYDKRLRQLNQRNVCLGSGFVVHVAQPCWFWACWRWTQRGNITASWQQEARVPVSPSTGCLGSFLLLNPSHHRPYHLLLYHQRPTEDTEDLSHNRRHVYKSVLHGSNRIESLTRPTDGEEADWTICTHIMLYHISLESVMVPARHSSHHKGNKLSLDIKIRKSKPQILSWLNRAWWPDVLCQWPFWQVSGTVFSWERMRWNGRHGLVLCFPPVRALITPHGPHECFKYQWKYMD